MRKKIVINRNIFLVLAPFCFFLLISAKSFANDVHLTWEKAIIFLPNTSQRVKSNDINLEKKYPVLIYLHGCTGIHPNHDLNWGEYISKMGFLVIMPDSFARQNREANCDPIRQRRTNRFPDAYKYRQEEIIFTVEKIKKISFVDQKSIFLMGHSEGGIATAQSSNTSFIGLIISGWSCTDSSGHFPSGIKSPKTVPVLAIADVNDPWRVSTSTYGRCKDVSSDRDITQVDLKNSVHETFHDEIAQDEVFNFLNKKTSNHIIVKPKPFIVLLEPTEIDEPLIELGK
jgi:hypothetical protein